MKKLLLLLAAACCIASCAEIRTTYIGKAYPTTGTAPELYFDWKDVPSDYETMGSIKATPFGKTLEEALRAAGVTEVDVVGLAESHCVACTAVDAVRAGFPTRVLRELTAPVSEELGASAREWMMTEGVLLV